MGNRPSSKFGFGVILSAGAVEYQDKPKKYTPSWLLANDSGPDGITIVESGYCDEAQLFVVVEASLSCSDDWAPKRITQGEITEEPDWAPKINAFIDKWSLRDKLVAGFEIPSFIHTPYYG